MKSTILFSLMFLIAFIAINKSTNAQVLDANACPFKSDYIQKRNVFTSDSRLGIIFFPDSIRELSEINVKNLADAYPYLSSDGLRLYYTCQVSSSDNLFVVSRDNINSYFGNKELLSTNFPYGAISCWLTNDELEIYFVKDNMVYHSTRPSLTSPFSVPTCVSLVGGNNPTFISGPSLTPNREEMYIFSVSIYGNRNIFKFLKTGIDTYTLNDTLDIPYGYFPGPGQLSKDGLKYYLSLDFWENDSVKLYRFSRPNLNENFSNLSILDDSINNSHYLANMQPSVSANNDILVWVRSNVNTWSMNDLYIGYGTFTSVKSNKLSDVIRIYPNPAKGKIYIDFHEANNAILLIYNIMGDLLMKMDIQSGINEKDISHLSKGIYIIKIKNENSSMQQKLIIQ